MTYSPPHPPTLSCSYHCLVTYYFRILLITACYWLISFEYVFLSVKCVYEVFTDCESARTVDKYLLRKQVMVNIDTSVFVHVYDGSLHIFEYKF